MSLYCALEIRVDGNGPSLIIRTFWLKKKRCQANKHTDKHKITNTPKCDKGNKDHEMTKNSTEVHNGNGIGSGTFS